MSSSINISGLTSSTDYSSLFSSLSSSSSSDSSSTGTSLYSDWASLKNGSYAKLAKAYYAKDSSVDADTVSATKKSNILLKGDADSLSSAVSGLNSSQSLFSQMVKSTDEDGNETEDYDYDKIISKLKSFVSNYNSVIKSGGDSDNRTVLRNTLGMTNLTSKTSKVLASAGISIGEDNTLSLDESKVNASSISALKTLFGGTGSYGDSISNLASNVSAAAVAENNKLATYTASGSYSGTGSSGSIYDGTL